MNHYYSAGVDFQTGDLRQLRISRSEFERETQLLACEREARVYLVECEGKGRPIKIGYARLPERRLQTLRTYNPYPLRFIGMLRGERTLELALHTRFRSSQIHGEWFARTPELLALTEGWL